jgi:lincosamide nucleotidyltransferase A/C/D/E
MTPAGAVHTVLDVLDQLGIAHWLDGGWGVDALLGYQTRPHADVDVVIDRADIHRASAALEALGFRQDLSALPGLPARLVLSNGSTTVDVHPVVRDSEGNGWQELGDRAWGLYSAEGLRASGLVDGRSVPCITAELQVRHHMGYPPTETDLADMRALGVTFAVALPPDWLTH